MEKILFVGDSLIAYYDWQQRFPQFDCVNLGLPGETVAGCLGQVPQVAYRHPEADRLVVMIGTNNLVNSDYAFVGQYEGLLAALHKAYPAATVAACSLLPLQLSWLAPDTAARMNELLKDLANPDWSVYLDIYASFQAVDTASCFSEDGVHLSAEGYRRWAAVLADWLQVD